MRNAARAAAIVLALTVSAGTAWGAGVSLTLKGGYFLPTDSVFKDAYGGGPVFGGEVAVPVAGALHLWAGAEYFSKKGLTTITEEEIKAQVIPLYAGIRCHFGKSGVRPYLGLAAGYFLVKEENPEGSASDSGLGLLGQAGLLFKLGGSVWLDLLVNYRACTLTSDGDDPFKTKLDGLAAGLGIVYKF